MAARSAEARALKHATGTKDVHPQLWRGIVLDWVTKEIQTGIKTHALSPSVGPVVHGNVVAADRAMYDFDNMCAATTSAVAQDPLWPIVRLPALSTGSF